MFEKKLVNGHLRKDFLEDSRDVDQKRSTFFEYLALLN